ncbi:hypothetical protein NL676_033465 [Syzygium grande]|nr:hypothetical protein NL676_033465 [Syzygium grande]
MEVSRSRMSFFAAFALLSLPPAFILLPSAAASAAATARSPAPAPSSDGLAIDQGIAYLLMLVALALTYIIH